MVRAKQTIYHDADHPSAIVLPIIPRQPSVVAAVYEPAVAPEQRVGFENVTHVLPPPGGNEQFVRHRRAMLSATVPRDP